MSPRKVAEYHRDRGFDAIAITDHRTITEPPDVKGITVIRGVEWNVGNGLRHLLEYPDHDFRIFPHPTLTGIKGDRVRQFMEKYDAHGVEIYNRGLRTAQLDDAREEALPISSSDFHHPGDEKFGYMTLRAGSRKEGDIMRALKSKNAQSRIRLHRRFNPADLPARGMASLFNMLGLGKQKDDSNKSSNPNIGALGMFRSGSNAGSGESYKESEVTTLR